MSRTWDCIRETARQHSRDGLWNQDVYISKEDIEAPEHSGFRNSIGIPRGQKADFRKRHNRGCLHVLEYDTYYLAHWDIVDPLVNPIEHFIVDVLRYFFRILKAFFAILTQALLG